MVESFTLGLHSESLDDLSTASECLEIWQASVGFESRSPLLALLLHSCVALGKLLDFSEALSSCVNWQSQNLPPRGLHMGFADDSDGKEPACNEGDMGLIPGSGRSPGEGNGNSSILAWRTPWTEKPGGLQYMESQTISHD